KHKNGLRPRLPTSGSSAPPVEGILLVPLHPASWSQRRPIRGKKRSKSRQTLDLFSPAPGPSPRKEDGVYRIFEAQGQTQILDAESATKPRRLLDPCGDGQ